MTGEQNDTPVSLSDGLGTLYIWDAKSRLVSAGGATYTYDALGQRVSKSGVGVTDTVYFGGQPIARYAGGQWTDLIYGPTGLLAEVPGTQTGAPVYRVTDHLGSTVGSLLADGSFVNPMDYTPFGQVFAGSTSDPYKFTGYDRDAESGLDYASARQYGSNIGRFISPDPSGLMYADPTNPQSLNLYSYVLNNPLGLVDPSGLWHCVWNSSTGDKDDTEANGGASEGDCDDQGGIWQKDSEDQVDQPDYSMKVNVGLLDYAWSLMDSGGYVLSSGPDPDTVRIDGLVQSIATRTASFPTVCSISANARMKIPLTPLAAGVSVSPSGKVAFSAKWQQTGANQPEGEEVTSLSLTSNGTKVGQQISIPVPDIPFLIFTMTVPLNGPDRPVFGLSGDLRKIGLKGISISVGVKFGYIGEQQCRPGG